MRLVSLDYDHPAEARADLTVLASQLRDSGHAVEIAGADEPHRVRFQKGAADTLGDVLNVVLDETERHLIDVVLTVISVGHYIDGPSGDGRQRPWSLSGSIQKLFARLSYPNQRVRVGRRLTPVTANKHLVRTRRASSIGTPK
jgi:hypothetical protein